MRVSPTAGRSIVVFAPAHDQAEIAKKILDTTDAASKTARLALNNIDAPQTADRLKEMLAIDPEKAGALYIGSDAETNSLIVRGTDSQVKDIENILRVLGEGQGGSVRIIPIRGNMTDKVREFERLLKQGGRNIPVKINIVPGQPPVSSLLVGVDYTTTPAATVIGEDGIRIEVLPGPGPRLNRLAPASFETGSTVEVFGTDLGGADLEVVRPASSGQRQGVDIRGGLHSRQCLQPLQQLVHEEVALLEFGGIDVFGAVRRGNSPTAPPCGSAADAAAA